MPPASRVRAAGGNASFTWALRPEPNLRLTVGATASCCTRATHLIWKKNSTNWQQIAYHKCPSSLRPYWLQISASPPRSSISYPLLGPSRRASDWYCRASGNKSDVSSHRPGSIHHCQLRRIRLLNLDGVTSGKGRLLQPRQHRRQVQQFCRNRNCPQLNRLLCYLLRTVRSMGRIK